MRLVKQPHTRAFTLMLAQAEQIAYEKEVQHKILLAIVLLLKKTLDQIKSQVIKLSKAPTRGRNLQLIDTLLKQRKVEQALQKYMQMLWAMRPQVRRQPAVR